MDYSEKQQMKLERYSELEAKAEQRSEAAAKAADRIADIIPFGQPILIGHHSEGMHRRDLNRIHNLTNKTFEERDKAAYYANKINNIQNPTAISSDNPEAVNLLKAKLEQLEKKHQEIKAIPKEKRHYYDLPYSSAEIKRVKERIEKIEAAKNAPDINETINGINIKLDKEENRLKVFFPDIPSEETRALLKQNGFRWSPYNKAWQRQPCLYALDIARRAAGEAVQVAAKQPGEEGV